jgi:16S rRNA (guanine966-N2)-methyltransferase
MRIISGHLKGRRFEIPSDRWKTRPTTDMAREGLFNILQHRIELEGIEVLDLFSGSGALGYEFLSRGAEKVTMVEKFGGCIKFIKKQLKEFGIEDRANLIKMEVFSYLKQSPENTFDLVFADPPYAMREMLEIPDLVFNRQILKSGGLLIIEHDDRYNFENHVNFAEVRKYGQSRFSFFEEANDAG